MLRKIIFLFIFFRTFYGFAIDSLNINNTILNASYPNKFTSVSSMAINEQLEYLYDSIAEKPIAKMRNSVYDLIKPLHLKVLRFPGGTIANYYHFYGKGYGIDTSETNCAVGRLGSTYANQSLYFDRRVDKNVIEYFKEEVDTLKQNGDNTGVAYRINSHTHFYKGDLIKYSDSIQYLISKYFNNDSSFLNTNGNSIDTNKVNSLASKLVQLQGDNVIKRIKNSLLNDAGFMYRFKENFDGVNYLRANNINIIGFEIGNETDAEYIIYDDDLSYLGYDCTNIPDSLEIKIFDLPMKYYFEGLIKNYILISLYSDTIKARYNIPIGVPAYTGFNYITLNNNQFPILIKRYDLIAKKADIWNKYYGLQSNIFALIPHIYSQAFMDCNTYANADTIGLDRFTLNKIAERFFKAYIDSVVTYNLSRVNYFGNNKPLWVTEWNFTDGSFATNTFLHAIYNYYFIRKAMLIHEFSPNYIQIWMYHFLVGAYHGWPLIRTGNNNQNQYFAEKQITYEPFYIWSNTMNQDVKRLKTPFWQTTENSIIDAFINAAQNEMYIQYVNSDSTNHYITLKDLKIKNNSQELRINKIDKYILDAASFTSTNFTNCTYINQQVNNNDYEIIKQTLNNYDTLFLPALSMGKFTLQLANKLTTNISTQKNSSSKIYPNPTNSKINLVLQDFNYKDNFTYEIYNALGKFILSKNLKTPNTEIDVTDFATGLYYMQIKRNTEIIDNHNFIKN